MTPDFESIYEYKNNGIFLHMGYYGFPTNTGLSDVVKYFKNESTIIVEDVTHTLFSKYPRYEENDYYFASIRKWVGLPSGGFIASPKRNIKKDNIKHNETFASIRKEALLLKASYIRSTNKELKSQYLDLFSKGENILNNDLKAYYIDSISKEIINTLDVKKIKEKRCKNFKILLEGLRDVEYIESVFKGLTDDTCPLFYPVYINKSRNEVQQKLKEKDIYCPIHWPIPKQIKYGQFKNAEKIYNKILSIPCDQRYGVEDMERIISVLRQE